MSSDRPHSNLPLSMPKTHLALLTLLLLAPMTGPQVSVARADDVISISGAPVLTVHSSGGAITIYSSDDPGVRVLAGPAGQRISVSRFKPDRFANSRVMLPERCGRARSGRRFRPFCLPARQFTVPAERFGDEGFSIDNPGGDMSIGVPRRVGAIFINSEGGKVTIARLRGPFVVSAAGGEVRLLNVVGRGLVRTTSGNITLGGVGGDVHVQTASGAITVFASFAERADVSSEVGPITWRFARVGSGAYKFRSKEGAIHLGFLPGVAAQVDAQSNSGNVQNLFQDAQGAAVRAASPHVLSIAINGGGPEITATSTSGDISVEPATRPQPSPSP